MMEIILPDARFSPVMFIMPADSVADIVADRLRRSSLP